MSTQHSNQSVAHGKQIVEPEDSLPEITFSDLPETLQTASRSMGWTDLMPVQAKAIPYIMAGRDLMVQSRTGSGKTGAFILPILDRIDPGQAACQALVLVPTRELALQVAGEAEKLSTPVGVRTAAVYGGVSYGPQLEALRKGAHIIVGTPGRILDHLLKKTFTLDGLRILVFDEADRMLSMGFYPDMQQLKRYLPRKPLNGYMFSATYTPRVIQLSQLFLKKPEMLSLSRDNVHVADITHDYYEVPSMTKDRCLVRIIEVENPDSAIIFCNMKTTVHYVTVVLKRFGYDADELTSDLPQNKREKIMGRVRNRSLRFLVATDIAARGIDIPDLSHVIQYEPPEDPEVYIHRAGRTGRAGAGGEAISLVDPMEKMKLRDIAKQFHIEMDERPVPRDEDVAAIVSERVANLLRAKLHTLDQVQTERINRFTALSRSLLESEDDLPMIALLLEDFYYRSLNVPEPVKPTAEDNESSSQNSGSSRNKSRPRRRSGRK